MSWQPLQRHHRLKHSDCCVHCACVSAPESDDVVIQVWDISRAHQHCVLKRKVFIRLPEEDPN
eukprot:1626492-Amphidinium_carterae.1